VCSVGRGALREDDLPQQYQYRQDRGFYHFQLLLPKHALSLSFRALSNNIESVSGLSFKVFILILVALC
jgi:hypothetical protein